MFSPFDELERWFEGAFPMLRQRRFGGGSPSRSELPAVFEGRMPSLDDKALYILFKDYSDRRTDYEI